MDFKSCSDSAFLYYTQCVVKGTPGARAGYVVQTNVLDLKDAEL